MTPYLRSIAKGLPYPLGTPASTYPDTLRPHSGVRRCPPSDRRCDCIESTATLGCTRRRTAHCLDSTCDRGRRRGIRPRRCGGSFGAPVGGRWRKPLPVLAASRRTPPARGCTAEACASRPGQGLLRGNSSRSRGCPEPAELCRPCAPPATPALRSTFLTPLSTVPDSLRNWPASAPCPPQSAQDSAACSDPGSTHSCTIGSVTRHTG